MGPQPIRLPPPSPSSQHILLEKPSPTSTSRAPSFDFSSPPRSPFHMPAARLRHALHLPRSSVSLTGVLYGGVFFFCVGVFLTALFPPALFGVGSSVDALEASRAAGEAGWTGGGEANASANLGLGGWGDQSRRFRFGQRPPKPSRGRRPDHVDISSGAVETTIKASARGFTAFENVYLKDGIWWIVSHNASGEVPPLHHIHVGEVPTPGAVNLSDAQIARHIRLISPDEAAAVLAHETNGAVGVMQGTTWVWKENFFLAHYGHMAQELFFGTWKTSTMAWPSDTPTPDRLFFTLFNEAQWRDKPGLNSFTLRTAFPSLSFLTALDFSSLSSSSLPVLLRRVVFVDRQAAKLAPPNAIANKMVAELGAIHAESKGDRKWWDPIRKSVVASVGGDAERKRGEPVRITYVSRQEAVHRRLREEDHEGLVEALTALEVDRGSDKVEVQIVRWENMTAAEQIRVASRTTIFISLHGNGLSHQLWSPPSPYATTVELLYPGGWARDFELVATMLGRRHYAFWDDVILHGKEMEPEMRFPEEFHLHSTPVKASAVITLLEAILDGKPVPPHRTKLA